MGFFNPIYNDKLITSGAALIEYTSKETYFRDVYLFLEYARNVASLKGEKLVYTNLWIYFKGPILAWWLSKLSENDKRLIKLRNKLEE